MGLVQEFKDFAFKGNVVDLAVAVIIGGAFGKIISSFVDDVITPLLLNPALEAANLKNISELMWHGVKYGNFLSAVISFLIIAIILFIVIKAVSKVNKPAEVAPAGPTDDQMLLAEIRDLLKNRP